MSEAIDLADALDRVQDDKELLGELFEIFQEDFPVKREALGKAVEEGDVEQVRSIAHGLKGSTGNISAHEMHANFKQIEILAKDGSLDGIAEKLVELDAQYAAVKAFMDQFDPNS